MVQEVSPLQQPPALLRQAGGVTGGCGGFVCPLNARLCRWCGRHREEWEAQQQLLPRCCRAMNTIKNLGSTGIYAYTTLISVPICAWGELPLLLFAHVQCCQ